MTLGQHLRQHREQLQSLDRRTFTLRQVAGRIGIEPSLLSKIERGHEKPSEEVLRKLAADLSLDKDVLLAMAGKVSSDLMEVITRRPALFAELIRELRDMPDQALLRVVREVRDGNW